MVLAYGNDRARLRALLSLAGMHDEANFDADVEPVKAAIDDRVRMEIHLLAVDRGDDTVALFDEKLKHTSVALTLMDLDVASVAPDMLLELATNRIEAITHGYVDVLMGVMLGRVAPYHDFSAGHPEIGADVIEAAVAMTATGRFNDDATARNAAIESLELTDAFTHLGFDRVGPIEVPEGNLEGYLHDEFPF
jgi:hypothetical protein